MKTFTVLDLLDLELERPNALDLRCVAGRKGLVRTIVSPEINRPGLALTGFIDKFVGPRVQIFGRGEYAYLEKTPYEVLAEPLKKLFTYDMPCFVFCYDLEPTPRFQEMAEEAEIPVLVTPLDSSALSIRILRALGDVFAPQQTIHGVFLEVEGTGVLIEGESGVGKSETALALLDRGHRLVADDAVLVKCFNGDLIMGFSTNKVMGHHMEIRGLGIIDIESLFGMNAVREKKKLELVVRLEDWDSSKNYDRIGTAGESVTILGVPIPEITLPVKPGRNIAIIVEAAVLNERLKQRGIHTAQDFNKNLIQWLESENARNLWFDRFVQGHR